MSLAEAIVSQLVSGALDSLLAIIPLLVVERIFRHRPALWWRAQSWPLAVGCVLPSLLLTLAVNGHVGYQLVPFAATTGLLAFYFQRKRRSKARRQGESVDD